MHSDKYYSRTTTQLKLQDIADPSAKFPVHFAASYWLCQPQMSSDWVLSHSHHPCFNFIQLGFSCLVSLMIGWLGNTPTSVFKGF